MTETFEKACPEYIAMGMTYEQFWYGESSMVIPYRKAFQIRQEEQKHAQALLSLL